MIFTRATIRLTAAFTTVQLVLFAAFAIGVYAFVTGTFDFDTAEADGAGAVNAAERGFATLRTGLIVSYCVLLVVVPTVSYVMARITLRPIRLSYERQQRFVDGASHELRTPLSIIQGELELVTSRRRTPDDYETAIAISLEAIDNLTHLTDDLLLLSQGDSRYPSSSLAQVDLNEAVMDAAKAVNSTRNSTTPSLIVDLGAPITVPAARALVVRAVINLIDNALKFTPTSGTIRVSTTLINGAPAVLVRDTGTGMTGEEMNHAFERFWRADAARSRPGHGIGLSLVRQIMDAHGGTATISEADGGGTLVSLVLPRTRV